MRAAPDYCPHCGVAVLRAWVYAEPLAIDARLDVLLDPKPTETGTVWIDANGQARARAQFYVEGESLYRTHRCIRTPVPVGAR